MLDDFKYKMLGDYFKLSNALTANQLEMLCVRYRINTRDHRYQNYIDMDEFVRDVQEQSEGVHKEQQLGGGHHRRAASKGYRSPQRPDDFDFSQEWRQAPGGPAGSY